MGLTIPRSQHSPAWSALVVVALAFSAVYQPAPATAGRFINLVETAAIPAGEGEVVQATAFNNSTGTSNQADVLELQVGVEYGLFHGFHAGFALPAVATIWADETATTEVGGTSFWGLYNLLDPEKKGWGLSCAAVFHQNSQARAGEFLLLVEKPLGNWVLVYNGTVGRTWARLEDLGYSDGMSHSLGASYELSPSLFIGVEVDWYLERAQAWESSGRYTGPNMSVDTGPLWITASAHFAVEPDGFVPDQVFQAQIGFPF